MSMPNCDHDKLVCPASTWAEAQIRRLAATLQKISEIDARPAGVGQIARAALRDAVRD
jgi:hypothetical protein